MAVSLYTLFCILFYFPEHTFPHVNKVHTPVLWRAVEHFTVAFKVLNNLDSYFSANFYFPLTWYAHPTFFLSPTFLPIHRVHVHPWCWVLFTCPSFHPPFLTVITLTLCSKHILSVTPLSEKDAFPIYQMRTLMVLASSPLLSRLH